MTTPGGQQAFGREARRVLARLRHDAGIVWDSVSAWRSGPREAGVLGEIVARWLRSDSPLLADERITDALVAAFVQLYQPVEEEDLPSPVVRRAIVDQFHRLYYHDSQLTWRQTSYRGVPILKCPLDLWIYQEIIGRLRPDLIVETGTAFGGSAYFMGDLCDTWEKGHVVSIDIEEWPGRPMHPRVTYLKGSSVERDIVEQVAALIPADGTVLVILDSDHSMHHVRQELDALAPMVTLGSYVIVEDTNVHGHPALPSFPAGPMEGLRGFLDTTDEFEVDTDQEKFMMTFNPSGYLKRVKVAPKRSRGRRPAAPRG